MDFRILGPLEVFRDGVRVDLGSPRQRALLARLLVSPREVVTSDRLVGVEQEPEDSRPSTMLARTTS